MNTSHMEEFDVIEIYLRHGDYPIGRYQYIKDKKIMVAVLPVQQRLQVHWLTCGVIAIALKGCHSDFGPGDFGPAGPKSPENTAGISVRGTIITRDIGPGPDILVRVANLRLGSPLRFCAGSILSLCPSTAL